MMMSQDATWNDGEQIQQSVVIAAGVTVTIAPGATVTLAAGASITVLGTLTGSSMTGSHAVLTAPSSGTWAGIVVGSGGTLSLEGVDLTNAVTGIEAQGGDSAATYNGGTITGAQMPFRLDTGSTLYLTYAKGPSSEGIVMEDPTATMTISDSTFTGSGPAGDMLVSVQGSKLSISYSTITNVHCAFHFDSISGFDISYVTADSNAWGAMLYGSSPGAGPYTITSSNFAQNSAYALDEEGTNGTITVSGCYIAGQDMGISATNAQSAPVANAQPR
jgi:hypothetical protein